MKLIIAILQDSDADKVTQALTADDFRVTRIASTGGFLRRGVVTLLIGLDDSRVDAGIEVIRANVVHQEGQETQGTIFVLPVNNFTQV
jgi:uncharacterized protein YaaQ